MTTRRERPLRAVPDLDAAAPTDEGAGSDEGAGHDEGSGSDAAAQQEPGETLAELLPELLSEPEPDLSLRAALPGLARLAITSARRTMEWSVHTTTATTNDILRSVAAGEPAAKVVTQTAADLRAAARQLLGIEEPVDPAAELGRPTAQHLQRAHATPEDLRRRGAELLYDSANVWLEEDIHPAYERILDELSPDEARILRLLAVDGPQPAIDVRTNRPLGVGSELVASGLSMIGLQAGVRHPDRTQADLNNLHRLGLVWFSREEVDDPTRYQVVEVQPDVVEAMKRAGRSPKTVHRSIHLTPFGEDFCRICFPL